VSFLAAGEYNENYLVTAGDGTGPGPGPGGPAVDVPESEAGARPEDSASNGRYVFRINHGSQLGLEKHQIEYEFRVLKAVELSGVTPKPLFVDRDGIGRGRGVMLMQFLPGRPLDYESDSEQAAEVFAQVHELPVSEELIRQENPVLDIARESAGLMERYTDHPMRDVYRLLKEYHARVLRLADEHGDDFRNDRLCIVNTEVNSGNFLVHRGRARLVDWEKAVVSCRYQDLGHFLVPTTTQWKTDFTFDRESRGAFLRAYAQRTNIELEKLSELTRIMEQTILLRALSWCYMAYYEYTRRNRELKDEVTFNKISQYLGEAECILN
jgi:aminoglycoside phosphotransferase (APT) family kinase protein